MTDQAARLAAALAGRDGIERQLGAGSMATVYLAHDEKHDRKVAIEVLKLELTPHIQVDILPAWSPFAPSGNWPG